jgi:hypothetical protein
MKNSRRNQVEDKFFLAYDDGVAGVVSALIADNDITLFAEKIGDFAFSFIAPLGTD